MIGEKIQKIIEGIRNSAYVVALLNIVAYVLLGVTGNMEWVSVFDKIQPLVLGLLAVGGAEQVTYQAVRTYAAYRFTGKAPKGDK